MINTQEPAPRILVTGGTGYIGSHTATELIEQGFEVLVVDNLHNSSADVVNRIEQITGRRPAFEKIDLCDTKATAAFFQEHPDIKAVVHFAAYKAVGESVQKPLMYYHNNLNALINVLENMQKYAIQHIVFSSSCTVYGQPGKLPVTEQAPIQRPNSPYGNTKRIAEEIIEDTIAASKKLSAIALRYFNPIGAHHSALIGELPQGVPNNLVPFITQTVAGVREQLRVFGTDYNTPDGTCIRDYIHVMDLAKAHVVAVSRMLNREQKQACEFFNIGTGHGASVMEVINTFQDVNNVKVNYRKADRRPGDVEKIWADTTLANNELGWKTQLSLADALKSAWEWEQFYRKTKS